MTKDDNVPRYDHYCEICTFLGRYGDADLYFCTQGGPETLVARYSNEGSDYVSGLGLSDRVPDLVEAKRRAIELGLLFFER